MLISDVLPVMVDDALLSSHPIIVSVSTPAEITSVFDSISYSKVSVYAHPMPSNPMPRLKPFGMGNAAEEVLAGPCACSL